MLENLICELISVFLSGLRWMLERIQADFKVHAQKRKNMKKYIKYSCSFYDTRQCKTISNKILFAIFLRIDFVQIFAV